MLVIAAAALLVLSSTAEAASKYNYGGRDSYEPSYKRRYAGQAYREPHHDSYDEDHYGRDAYSEEPTYTYELQSRPSYRHKRAVRQGQIFGKGLGLGQMKRIGNSDARVQIHIFTGQAQEAENDAAQAQDADAHADAAQAQDQHQHADAAQAQHADADSRSAAAAAAAADHHRHHDHQFEHFL